jgi:hypothetical protein
MTAHPEVNLSQRFVINITSGLPTIQELSRQPRKVTGLSAIPTDIGIFAPWHAARQLIERFQHEN